MKRPLILGLAVATGLTLFAAGLQAQQQKLFQGVTVTAEFVQAPIYQASVNQIETNERWIEIKVDYTTAVAAGGKTTWQDDVTVEYEVLLPKDEKGKDFVMLTGKVSYWSIPMDGKAHQAMAYIHPRFIQRYAPELKLSKGSLKFLFVKTKFTVNSAEVGGGYFLPRGRTSKDAGGMFQKAATMPGLTRVIDGVFGPDKTPWLFINPGLYEMIKQGSK